MTSSPPSSCSEEEPPSTPASSSNSTTQKRLKKVRLDQLLHERGLTPSREKSQRAILAGMVTVEGQVITKAGTKVADQSNITLKEPERYVGRGAYKLEGALQQFHISPKGWHCLDLGSSTGGFTDCLLQHGATKVTAIDVGKGQLAWSLRQDPRVILYEGVNARYLRREDLEAPPSSFLSSNQVNHTFQLFDLIVADLSFISLTKVLPAAFPLLAPTGKMILLIKPQFELSAAEVGRGGIVREETLRQEAVASITSWLAEEGYFVLETMESPIKGAQGNVEFLTLVATTPSPSHSQKITSSHLNKNYLQHFCISRR